MFLSHRRGDAAGHAGRLANDLRRALGRKNVVMDLDRSLTAEQYDERLAQVVGSCDYFVALIGGEWWIDDEGGRPLENEDDPVRREVLTALDSRAKVLPVVIHRARAPAAEELPEALRPLAAHPALEITDHRWKHDVRRLIKKMGGGRLGYRLLHSRWVKVVLIAIALFWLFAQFMQFATRGARREAEEFLTLLGRGEIEAAYQSTASSYRRNNDLAAFDREVTALGLRDNAEVSWHGWLKQRIGTTLFGDFLTKQREELPLEILLIREDDDWRVAGLGSGERPFASTPPTAPAEEELQPLVRAALLDFDRVLQTGDVETFYGSLSEIWKSQTTPQQLEQDLQPFRGANLGFVAETDAVLERIPEPDEDGVLKVIGYYPRNGTSLAFELQFVYEHPEWKLLGISFPG